MPEAVRQTVKETAYPGSSDHPLEEPDADLPPFGMKLVENPKLPLPEEPLLPEKPRSGVLLIVDYLRSLVGYDDGGPTTDSTLKSTTSPAP